MKMLSGVWMKVDTEVGDQVLFFGSGGIVQIVPTSVKGMAGSSLNNAEGKTIASSPWSPDVIARMIGVIPNRKVKK